MPDPDDLDLAGLDRLAPTVDAEAGRAVFDHRRHRRARDRVLARVGIAVVAVAVVGATLALRPSSKDTNSIDSATTSSTEGDVTTAVPRTVTKTQDGVEIAITVAPEVSVGARLPVQVVITNTTDREIFWQSGGCAIPSVVTLVPATSPEPPLDDGRGGPYNPQLWEPPGELLVDAVDDAASEEVSLPFQAEDRTGQREIVCPSDARFSSVAPGATLQQDGSIEVRMNLVDFPDDGDAVVQSVFDWNVADPTAPESATGFQPVRMVARAVVKVLEDPHRYDPDGAAIAFAADPRLATWIEQTSDLTAAVEQTYSVELTWWRGQWELWVRPTYSESDPRYLRMRFNPVTKEITDVRTVEHARVPEDEPGAVQIPMDSPDVIL